VWVAFGFLYLGCFQLALCSFHLLNEMTQLSCGVQEKINKMGIICSSGIKDGFF
jgi:hypothetical protein